MPDVNGKSAKPKKATIEAKPEQSVSTGEQEKPYLFQPGQSGNPAGRPKGSRNKLGEAFIQAMYADFTEHGSAVIETVRTEKPDQYLKVVASILPQQLNVKVQPFEEMTDDQLRKHAERLIRELGPVFAFTTGGGAERGSDPQARKPLN